MKKLLLCSFLALFYVYTIYAQENTLYLSFQPTDLGVGLRYDKQFDYRGVYASLSYGNYKFLEGYIRNHLKLSLGGIVYRDNSFITFGVAGHNYGDRKIPDNMDTRTFKRFSYELGTGVMFDNMNVAFRMDIFKWESSIDVGIIF